MHTLRGILRVYLQLYRRPEERPQVDVQSEGWGTKGKKTQLRIHPPALSLSCLPLFRAINEKEQDSYPEDNEHFAKADLTDGKAI